METLEPFKRANFFPGLQVGPVYWNSIEDYRFGKETLYNSLFHGFGIVPDFLDSLQVQAEKTRGGLITLLVSRGMAIDGLGRSIFLYEPQVLVLDPKKYRLPLTVYVTIRYEERLEDFYQNKENSDLQGYQRRLETAKLDILPEIREPDITLELARIRLSEENGGIEEIHNNQDFCDPGCNTLDYRFLPWASRMKKGVSIYLQRFLIDIFEYTRTVTSAAHEVIPIQSLRNLQTVSMTSKMIVQCAGVYFDDVIHLVSPLFDLDHQILFEVAEWERNHEDDGRLYTAKNTYESARAAMYLLGEKLKSYSDRYEELDEILKAHKAVMDGVRQTIVNKEVSSDDIKYISYAMPHILLYGEERYTLVDTLSFASRESIESHQCEFPDARHPSTSNEAFFYPDGTLVHDTVKRWVGGSLQFRLRNIIRGRKTLIIRRTDMHQGNYSVEVELDGAHPRNLIVDGVDTKNRWRNLFVLYDEGEISDNSALVRFKIGEKGRDNSGTVWVYQIL